MLSIDCECVYSFQELKLGNPLPYECFHSFLFLFEPHHGKTCICICENKDDDQLCGTAQLISAFVFASIDSTTALLPKSEIIFCGCTARFVSDIVENPEDRWFSRDAAHLSLS